MDNVMKNFEKAVKKDQIKLSEPLKDHTSFKMGGKCKALISPKSVEELREIIKICKENKEKFKILGNGTNLLISDKGINEIIIKITELKSYKIKENKITSKSGINLKKLTKIAKDHELSGVEFASGIPGTLGAAIAINAGAYGEEIKEITIKSKCINRNGKIMNLKNEEHGFSFRNSRIKKENLIVLETELELKKGNKKEIEEKMKDLWEQRKKKQPLEMPNCGSIFKRPENNYVGKMVEELGLKKYRIGDAQISEKHAGFIVNLGNAKLKEVKELMKIIEERIKEKYGIELEKEAEIWE